MISMTRRTWLMLLALALAASTIPGTTTQGQDAAPPGDTPTTPDAVPPTDASDDDAAPDTTPARAERRVALIRIDGTIYDFTLDSLERRVQRARDAGATMIAIELDTYGGTVTAALEISKYIKSLDLPTVMWVNTKAYSAGILISAAANSIVMAPAGTAGDCAPIVPGMELSPTERAKALTPLLAEFQDSARRNGYDFALLHAMCEYGIEVHEIRHKATGERKLVNQVDYEVMVKGTSMEDAGKPNFLQRFLPGSSDGTAIMLGIIEATDGDRGQWEAVRLVHNGRSLLTINAPEAVQVGLAKTQDIRTRADLERYLEADAFFEVKQTWSEDLAGWMTSMPVRTVLIFVLLIGAYAELQTPGVGVAGVAALVALLLLLAPPMIIGLAEVWHIVAIVAGFILLMVEVFVLPGFGVAGVSGLLLIVAGLIFMVVPTDGEGPLPMPSPEMWGMVGRSLLSVAAGLTLSIIGFIVLQRYMGNLPFVNRLVLRSEPSAAASSAPGAAQGVGIAGEAVVHLGGGATARVGDIGRATTDLRPVGRAEFEGQLIDVESIGSWVRVGQPVRIIDIEGNRIVVDLAEA